MFVNRITARGLTALAATSLVLLACSQPAAPAKPASAPAPTTAAVAPAATSAPAPMAAAPAAKPAAAPAAAPLAPPVPVRMGKLPLVSDSGMHIAVERGYFLEEGLQIDSIPFDSAGQMVAPMGSGQLEVGGGATGAGLFNAIARDVPLRIVADKGSMPLGAGWIALLVRPDLANEIRDYSDLRGRKIAINQLNTTNDVALDRAMRLGGNTLADADVIQLPFSDMNAALTNRNVDVIMQNEPFQAQALDQNLAVRFRGVDEYYTDAAYSVILYAPHFVRDQPEAARRWMAAYLKGVREYNDAFVKGVNRAEVIELIMRQVRIREASLFDKMVRIGLDPDGRVNPRSIREDVQWFSERGMVTQMPDMDRMLDGSFAEYAVSRLGPYQR